jgi:predicted nucleotidyltransferase
MDIFHREHRELLRGLVQSGVQFILVGGYAVNVHGYARMTRDLDLWLKPDNVNKVRLISYFRSVGYEEEGLKVLELQNFEEHFVFHIGKEPLAIDFLTRISGVDYETAEAQKIMLPIADFFVPVIHLHHLILSKTGTGRSQDIADIDNLQKVAEKRRKS